MGNRLLLAAFSLESVGVNLALRLSSPRNHLIHQWILLVRKSEVVVFSNAEGKVIDTGVYGKVRHPMYLGSLLILLGFTIATISILSFIVWVVFFAFLDRMATYEEKYLIRLLGQQYGDYKRKVHKWIPY